MKQPPPYEIRLERGDFNYWELAPLYRQHYGEMQARLAESGVAIGDYAPRLNLYFEAWSQGWLLNFVARLDGKPVGYSNIYLTNDMHNGELIAKEDTIYVTPEHRNGLGRRLTKAVLAELNGRGVRRALVTTQTDLRSGLLCKRLGFREVATQLMYIF